jgi:hypothetical protein
MAPPIIDAKAESRFPSGQNSRPDMAVTPQAPTGFARRPRMNDQTRVLSGSFRNFTGIANMGPNQRRSG